MPTAAVPRSTPSSSSSCKWSCSLRASAPSVSSCESSAIVSACADSLGYDLTEPLPNHSSRTRIRARYGLEVFRRFFEAIVEQCIGAGLVWGQELYIDATKVAANAALGSLQPRFAVETHLAHLFATAGDPCDGDLPNGSPGGADE